MQQDCTEMILDENGTIIGLDCILHRGLYTFEELKGKTFLDIFIKDENKQEVRECIDRSIGFKVEINYKRDVTKLVCFDVKHHSKKDPSHGQISLFGSEDLPDTQKRRYRYIR